MKVIFIDDSEIVLETFNRLIEDLIPKYNLECSFYSDSKEVDKLIKDEALEYDLMFLDIFMPEVDGYLLTFHAKNRMKYKRIPIVAITTEYSEDAQKRGAKMGIQEWLIKSIDDDSLLSSIETIIQRLQ